MSATSKYLQLPVMFLIIQFQAVNGVMVLQSCDNMEILLDGKASESPVDLLLINRNIIALLVAAHADDLSSVWLTVPQVVQSNVSHQSSICACIS
jgi:hypothetical protein